MSSHERCPQRLGYWPEMHSIGVYCPPQALVGTLNDEMRERVAAYLDTGYAIVHMMGYSWCRFGCSFGAAAPNSDGDAPTWVPGTMQREMGHAELTDGTWVWPQGLSHYVRVHAVMLPDAFVSHVCASDATAAERHAQSPMSDDDYLHVSEEFWIEWSRAHASSAVMAAVVDGCRAIESRPGRRRERDHAFAKLLAQLETITEPP